MKKLFGPLSATGGAALLAAASFLSYVVGFGRDLLVANFFGASGATDAFYAGFLLPDLLFTFLVLGFVSGALLPVFVGSEKKNKKHAEKVFHSFLTLVLLFSTLFATVSFFCTPAFVHAFFPESDTQSMIRITRILLLSPILFGISNTLGMILLARKRFFSMAISPALYNIGIIAGIVFFGKTYGIEAGAWGAVFGGFLHLSSRLLDFPKTKVSICFSLKLFHKKTGKSEKFLKDKEARKNLSESYISWYGERIFSKVTQYFRIYQFSPEIKEIFTLGLPKTLGLVSFQLTIVIFTILAAKTETGGVAAWNFARNVQSLPVSLFGIAFATAALPFLSDAFANKKPKNFAKQLEKSMVQILIFTLCAAVGMTLLGKEIVSVLFQHGAFDNTAALLTTSVLIPLALATPFESMIHLFSRAFLAHKKTIFPALGRFFFLCIASTLAVFLLPEIGIGALGLAFVCAAAAESAFLLTTFHFVCHPIQLSREKLFHTLFLPLCVATSVFAVIYLGKETNDFFRLTSAIILSGAVFLLAIFSLNIREIKEILFKK